MLAGHVMRTSTLVKLAAWKGDGAVPSNLQATGLRRSP